MIIRSIISENRLRLSFTLVLILVEAILILLFPLYIGKALDGALLKQYSGNMALGLLGFTLLIIGMGRRILDSRFYGRIYEKLGLETISKVKGEDTSTQSARLQLVDELIEFLENAFPDLIQNLIGLFGVVLILATLNFKIFMGSCVLLILILLVYWLSAQRTLFYNKGVNDEMEHQVNILNKGSNKQLKFHLQDLVRWNIKLSDLEALNFSISWLLALTFLLTSIVIAVGDGILEYGALIALIMYVFQLIENAVNLPLYYQNWLRLQEIMDRIENCN